MGKYECSSENFIIKDENDSAYSICREERQYAVFLYDILRKYKTLKQREEAGVTDIFEACLIPGDAVIKFVFYEATFMRDFYERNRRIALDKFLYPDKDKLTEKLLQKSFSSERNDIVIDKEYCFNYKLIEYCCNKQELNHISNEDLWKIENYNLGGLTECHKDDDKRWKRNDEVLEIISKVTGKSETKNILDQMRQMMNTKPDIAVIYEKDKSYLLFLECKLEYYETVDQRKIHGRVADFLCNYYFKGKLFMSENMKFKENNEEVIKSHLVQFVRKNPGPYKQEIGISDLIHLSERIFE